MQIQGTYYLLSSPIHPPISQIMGALSIGSQRMKVNLSKMFSEPEKLQNGVPKKCLFSSHLTEFHLFTLLGRLEQVLISTSCRRERGRTRYKVTTSFLGQLTWTEYQVCTYHLLSHPFFCSGHVVLKPNLIIG